jgi:NADP-dependent 3-hydroxy acid dehydrogenase YdfG
MNNNISNKVIVITGASSGLGEAAARHLSAKGAIVVLGARRLDRIVKLAEELANNGEQALAVQTDVTKSNEVKHLVDEAVKTFGKVDVIINNAGIMALSALESLRTDEWDKMIDINIKGVLYGIAAVLPYMKEQKSGHIINVSSVSGHVVGPTAAVYAATKHAVRAISEGFRQEVKEYNLRSTIISPGAVATELPSSVADNNISGGIDSFYENFAISAESFARCVAFAIEQPIEMDVNEILFRPTKQTL